ncbi:hypothetical protein Tcan_00678, partial [Toxocara canis]
MSVNAYISSLWLASFWLNVSVNAHSLYRSQLSIRNPRLCCSKLHQKQFFHIFVITTDKESGKISKGGVAVKKSFACDHKISVGMDSDHSESSTGYQLLDSSFAQIICLFLLP